MTRYVAFLRAINTPGRNVTMEPIRRAFRSVGLDNVATFIASGNVIFDTEEDADPTKRIEAALADEAGFEIPVYLRTAEEVRATAALDPFGGIDDFEVSFLPGPPDPDAAAALEATEGPNDRLLVVGREVYWRTGGDRQDSPHSEDLVVRTLGMLTTRRSIRTVRRIADRYLS